jgi:hypothetical protein
VIVDSRMIVLPMSTPKGSNQCLTCTNARRCREKLESHSEFHSHSLIAHAFGHNAFGHRDPCTDSEIASSR